jgi:hypothetical protein
MGEMGKGEMGTAHAGKHPSLPRELRTPLVDNCVYTLFPLSKDRGNYWATQLNKTSVLVFMKASPLQLHAAGHAEK